MFMSTRDDINFDRSFMEAFIRPGLDFGNWHDRGICFEVGVLHTLDTELSMYGMENAHLATQRIRRYTLRTEGFVSVNGGYSGGEFTTLSFVFSGSQLELNYSTSAVGSIKIEIQDAHGNPQSGFSLDEFPEQFGDEIAGAMHWDSGLDLSSQAGKPVRLRFVLKDADFYAFNFNSDR